MNNIPSFIEKNSTAIHITTEVVMMSGMVYYFYSKNNSLNERMVSLENKITSLEENIIKQDSIIKDLYFNISKIKNERPQSFPVIQPVIKRRVSTPPHMKKSESLSKISIISDNELENVLEEKEDSEEDLDKELQKELEELN